MLERLRGLDCTRLFITHRVETTRFADRIVVLDGGRIVQEGRFEALSARPGLFRDLLEGRAS